MRLILSSSVIVQTLFSSPTDPSSLRSADKLHRIRYQSIFDGSFIDNLTRGEFDG
jgi:hypothetical protein